MNSRFQPATLGDRIRQRDFGLFGITETFHRPNLILATHAHRFPALTIVREGGFGLRIGRDAFECRNTGVFFKLGDVKHSNRFAESGSRSLVVEIRIDTRDAANGGIKLPDRSFFSEDGRVTQLATALEREFQVADDASEMALEGLTLELLAAMLRTSTRPISTRPPAWMRRVIELLHDPLSWNLGLRDVAAEVGVHPVHVARTFRQHQGCSLGEYSRMIRVEYAARLLCSTRRPLAAIAANAGFHDQAHFSHCFKRQTGLTPSDYRRLSR